MIGLAILGILGTLGTPPSLAATEFATKIDQQYPVVAVGDSIFVVAEAEGWPADWHVDAQGSRNPYDPPPFVVDGRKPTSTDVAVAINEPLVAPGGVFVFQDVAGPLSVWGLTMDDWKDLVYGTVRALPDDRCLIVVTGFFAEGWPDVTGGPILPEQVAQNDVLTELAGLQPCHRTVRWDQAVQSDAGMLSDDGIHPSPAGVMWLRVALEMAVTDVTS